MRVRNIPLTGHVGGQNVAVGGQWVDNQEARVGQVTTWVVGVVLAILVVVGGYFIISHLHWSAAPTQVGAAPTVVQPTVVSPVVVPPVVVQPRVVVQEQKIVQQQQQEPTPVEDKKKVGGIWDKIPDNQ